ncbi:tetratricopeptide repeat protein [Alkalinema sp. FACHB-956]|uniref:tetratricopeptide repeat protein n=1 Tax=Alkalinema sp. FACHB-956 TaxID=2692768 RepID=UPI00168713BE|nr:tetratricopeptide repeat protein [Alkalinema sp. FACHB-956]MBD2330143.1 tetratricopeptide repeat protein [Alkalinema sp. FACHB-956]
MNGFLKASLVCLSLPMVVATGAIVSLVSLPPESPTTHALTTSQPTSLKAIGQPLQAPISSPKPKAGIQQTPQERFNEGLSYVQDGEWFAKKGKLTESRTQYEKALGIMREMDQKQLESVVLNGLGQNYKDAKNYTLAMSYYEEALSVNETLDRPSDRGRMLANLAEVHSLQKNHKQSLALYRQALDLAEGDGDTVATIRQQMTRVELALQPKRPQPKQPKATTVAKQPQPQKSQTRSAQRSIG